MTEVLLVSGEEKDLAAMAQGLQAGGAGVCRVRSGAAALELLRERYFDLVVVDETLDDMTGLALIGRIVARHPMIDTAAVSSLTPGKFHEASEGFGVLMQLPSMPDSSHAAKLLEQLYKIRGMEQTPAPKETGEQ